ncbi:hypothetical protein SDC9_83434 [bioreactor metagenome]|uniref:Uncharacterized protein n=1 Tax=bioreactor metagenome TaxID=1076179 RepID=A0A644ZA32_9ZZZZ
MPCPRYCVAAARGASPPNAWHESSRCPYAPSSETSMRWRTAARRSGPARARAVDMDWPKARPCRPSACPRRRPWRSWRPCQPHPMPPTRIWQQPVSGRSWTSLIPGPERKPTSWPIASGSTRLPPPRAQSGRGWRRRWPSSG